MPRQRVIGCALIALLGAILPTRAGVLSHVKRGGIDYEVYRCRPAELRLFWKDSEGHRYGQFRRLQEALARQGQRLVFAMNAGIFRLDPDGYSPCGLHVENGVVLHPLNRGSGSGNFYLEPNGVFFTRRQGWHPGNKRVRRDLASPDPRGAIRPASPAQWAHAAAILGVTAALTPR